MSVTSFPSSSRTDGPLGGDESRAFSSALTDLAERWGRGEPAAAEHYLHRGPEWSADLATSQGRASFLATSCRSRRVMSRPIP